MDSKLAIFDLGLSGNLAKPVAMALAVCGSMAAPGAQSEKFRQAEAQGDAVAAASSAPSSSPSSAPSPLPSPSLTAPSGVTGLTGNGLAATVSQAQPASVVTLPDPVTVPSVAEAANEATASTGSSPIARQSSSFVSGFAEVPDPESPPAIVEQVLGPVPPPVAPAPREATPAAADPVPAQLAPPPPVEIAAAQAPKIADLTAYDPAAKPAPALIEPAPAVQVAPAQSAAAIAFVSNPVVQSVPAERAEAGLVQPAAAPAKAAKPEQAAAPLAAARPKNQPKAAAAPAAPLPGVEPVAFSIQTKPEAKAAAAPKAVSKLATKPAATGKAGYRLHENVIDFALPARLNGENVGTIPLRVTRDDRLWVRLGDLLTIVRSQLSAEEFEQLSASSAASEYMDFEAVRRAGIALKYDAARNRIDLGSQ